MYDLRKDPVTGIVTRIDGLPEGMRERLRKDRLSELADKLKQEKENSIFQKPTNQLVEI